MTVGQVLTASGSSVCIAGSSAHAEYMLIPFFGDTASAAMSAFTVTGANLDTVSSVPPTDLAPLASVAEPFGAFSSSAPTADHSFELGLRRKERLLTPLIPDGRRFMVQRSGMLRSITPAAVHVGDVATVNVNSTGDPCTTTTYHTAHVMAVSTHAVIMADDSNPPGGFTPAQYNSIAAAWDTLAYPSDTANFGAPTDIDNNGRIILLYTMAVNQITPKNNNSSYVGGFFYSRDLFPRTKTASLDGCAGSNYAEIFYLLAPDPTGAVNGHPRGTAFVADTVTIATTGHEFQHLINASRRLYVNNASDWEEVWLNEGLSHIAEELLFYRSSGLQPRQNISLTTLHSSQAAVPAFNLFEIANFLRYRTYVRAPSANSPYAPNDSLATRGATWSMLRYLTDRRGTVDGNVWFQLVNSTTSGIANLKNVYGSDVINQIRDWSVSVFADDLSATPGAVWQQPSWNFRSIYPALGNSLFPLQTQTLTSAAPLPVTLAAGGSAYLRFATAPGKDATLTWSAGGAQPLADAVQFSVMRVR